MERMTKRQKRSSGAGSAAAVANFCDAPTAKSNEAAAASPVVEPGACRTVSRAPRPAELDTAGSGHSTGTATVVAVSTRGWHPSAASRSPAAAAAAAAALSRFSIAQALSKSAPTSSVPRAPANGNTASAASGARRSLAAAEAAAAACGRMTAAAGQPLVHVELTRSEQAAANQGTAMAATVGARIAVDARAVGSATAASAEGAEDTGKSRASSRGAMSHAGNNGMPPGARMKRESSRIARVKTEEVCGIEGARSAASKDVIIIISDSD